MRSLILAGCVFASSAQACTIGQSDTLDFKRPLSATSASIPAPDVRIEAIDPGLPGLNSAACEGIATLTVSVSTSLVPPGGGLVFEQVDPGPYFDVGPHGAYVASFERGDRLEFVFPISHSVSTAKPTTVTVHVFAATQDGQRGDYAELQYVLPPRADF